MYLAERLPGASDIRVRRVPAKWSAFFTGLEDDDRLALQRTREVKGLSVRGRYTRVDFVNKWERKNLVYRLSQHIDGIRAAGATGAGIFEADVNPLRRFLSDHAAINISTAPKLGWFDLETDSRSSFVDAVEFGRTRILCWALTTLDDTGQSRRVAEGLLEQNTDLAEKKLIEDFLQAAKQFDVLLAWSGDGFDFPVLELRASALRVKMNGMPIEWGRWSFLDCMEVFKKYNAHVGDSGEEKTSFKLNSIAQAILGEGKTDFDASRTWEAWSAGGESRRKLLDYNIQDTMLMPQIEAKTGYIALHIAVCAVTRCFPDSRSLMASQQGDGFLLRLGDLYGHRWPTKRHVDEDVGKYPGAYVMEPTRTGLIENVHVADFASLYPSIIRSWNISPETILYKLQDDPLEGSCKLPYSDLVRFSKEERGMFPRALDELVMRRSEYSNKQDAAEPGSPEWERYKRLSGAYKIVANSFYGIMGSAFTRFFSAPCAEAVTQTGAWLVKRVAAASGQGGLEAFYGDTDSVFVAGDSTAFTQVVADLNATWKPILSELGCETCHVKLEFEKSFSRIVLVTAKRYIGRFSVYKGKPVNAVKIEVKGLEYKRGDTMRLTRKMQRELIDLLMADITPTLETCLEFVEGWKQRILTGDLSIEDIVLSKSVKSLDEYVERFTTARCGGLGDGKKKIKCLHVYGSATMLPDSPKRCPKCGAERKILPQPVHVRVAKLLMARGEEMRSGTRVDYLIVSDEGVRIDAVPAWDEGALAKVNRDLYWNKYIYPPTARVLESAFPTMQWVETTGQRKRRRLDKAIAENKGKYTDLPLFEAMQAFKGRVRMRKGEAG